MSRNRIAVVEDEVEIAQVVCRLLEDSGFQTDHFINGRDLLHHLKREQPALCIIDLGLPDGDGLDLVRAIQARYHLAVIILTGRGGTTDRVVGLELGADDYIVKPFEPRELVARAKAVLRRFERRHHDRPAESPRAARFLDWTYNPGTYSLTAPDGRAHEISAAEAKLLLALLKSPNRVLTREQLLDLTGGGDLSPFDRSIDVRISRLRGKLEADKRDPQIIKTVYGAGYIFAASVDWVDES